MPTFYTVVRCVPDPIIGERLNIGVIVWGDGRIRSQFISNWTRLRTLGVKDLGFFKDFAARMEGVVASQSALPGIRGLEPFDEASLLRAIDTWAGAIQFSRPRASLRSPEVVLTDAARRFLRDRTDRSPSGRSRLSVATEVQREVEAALQARVGNHEAHEFLRRNFPLAGRVEPHTVDVSVVNGRPHLAAHGLSFEIRDQAEMRRHYTDAAYAASDFQTAARDVPFGVVVYPPLPNAPSTTVELYQHSVTFLPRAGAQVMAEHEFPAWAQENVDKIPPEVLGLLSNRAG